MDASPTADAGAQTPDPGRHGPLAKRMAEAAALVIDAGLRRRDSAFTPGRPVWSEPVCAELERAWLGGPDRPSVPFVEHLDTQLAGTSDLAIQLLAEIQYLRILPLSNWPGSTKCAMVGEILTRMASPATIPATLADALDVEILQPSPTFDSRRYPQLCWLASVAHRFAMLQESDRARALGDPIAFRDFVSAPTRGNEPSQRFALQYTAFPDFFVPVVGNAARQAIRRAFADRVGDPTGDDDRDLRRIADSLDPAGSRPDFYAPELRMRWDPKFTSGRRAWLVRSAGTSGNDMLADWLGSGFVSLPATRLREVPPGVSVEDLRPIVDEDYAGLSYAAKGEKVDELVAFLTRMQPGDIVVTTSQRRLYVGEIDGDPTYAQSEGGRSNLRRDVLWTGPEAGVDYDEVQPELLSRLQVQHDVLDVTQQIELLAPYVEVVETPITTAPTGTGLAPATPELADRLHVSRAWLQECIDLLTDRPQLIFYGPPGTGKTYIAQALAAHIAGDNVRLVQFHPAYSYEDFFEGYRPTPEGAFALRPGPFRKVVDQARENPGTPYVLIIDEINRGNLAKVFGELYFLLEYRDHNVDLLYASDDDQGFTLPRNVFVLGTMNTADRSIALVDAAMRRRFAFVALHPTEPPASGVLRAWLASEGYDLRVADVLDELNRRVDDNDFKIGPSYFMRERADALDVLRRTWRTAILPLLEEHHYGDGVDVAARYSFEDIWADAGRRGRPEPDGDEPAAATPGEPTVAEARETP